MKWLAMLALCVLGCGSQVGVSQTAGGVGGAGGASTSVGIGGSSPDGGDDGGSGGVHCGHDDGVCAPYAECRSYHCDVDLHVCVYTIDEEALVTCGNTMCGSTADCDASICVATACENGWCVQHASGSTDLICQDIPPSSVVLDAGG